MSERTSRVKGMQSEIQITSGSLWKNMFLFSVPLMLSQLLQVLFNMADVAVVGKFSSAEALGAVPVDLPRRKNFGELGDA